jgi:predicted AAA+ superfamily ATPase
LKWHDDDGLIVFDELHKYKNWLDVLERMYLVFAVPSYTKNLPRAVIKPPKFFFMTIMWLSLLPIFCIPHKCQLGSEMK